MRRLTERSTGAIRRTAVRSVLPLALAVFGATIPLAQERLTTTDIRSEFQSSLTAVPDPASLTVRGMVYVPAYSEIRIMTGRTRMDLAATLSVHNTSNDKPLVLDRIDYFDTAGALVQSYLGEPIALRPFATVQVFVAEDDRRGGTGANFAVTWAANGPITEPAIEAILIGGVGTRGFSIVSPGRPVRAVGTP